MATFADGLTAIIAQKRGEGREREKIAERWHDHEDKLLEVIVEKYKNRCMKEAEAQKVSATISFELLTRELANFPKHVVKDGSYIVNSWGDGSAEWWFYATRGTKIAYTSETQIPFAEVLESMMAQFIEYVKLLGFDSVQREPGTWKVKSCWNTPEPEKTQEAPAKRAKTDAPVAEAAREPTSPARTATPTPTDLPSDDDLCNALDVELKKGKVL